MAKIFDELSADYHVGAVILAAGRSTRMGRAKQLLPLGDATVLDTTIARVRGSAASEVVLVLGAAADRIHPQPGIRTVFNPRYEEGMATSLQVGISALSPGATSALIVLGDQPFVQSSTLDQLIAAHPEARDHALIPSYQGKRGNPVLIPSGFFGEVMKLEGDTGLRSLFGRHPELLRIVEVEDEGILLDIDSEEDYRTLSASH